jgi:tripartite-type tricarboxylate transporter receptor subunit TctC
MAYDSATAFAPVTLMARAPVVALAHPSLPATDLKGLEAVAKSRPGGVAYGSAGIGSMTHLTAELLKAEFGFALDHVPYKGGASALNDLLGGQIQLQFATVSQGLPYLQGGQVRALGITSSTRSRALPDVPTFKEQGFDMTVIEWYGLLAPAGTPPAIIAKLNTEVRRILALPDLGERVSSVELVGSTPEELGEFMRSETSRWGALIRRLGLKVE